MRKRFVALVIGLLLLLALPAGAASIVSNGSFETIANGLPADWSTSEWESGGSAFGVELDGGEDGSACIRIDNEDPNDARFTQTLSVSPQTIYRFSVRVKAEGGQEGVTGANISVLGSTLVFESVSDTGGAWQTLEFYGKTQEKQKEVTLALRMGGYSNLNVGTAWFDDVSVEEVSAVPDGAALYTLTQYSASSGTADFEYDLTPAILFLAVLFFVLFYILYKRRIVKGMLSLEQKGSGYDLALILLGAAFLRLVIAALTQGHPTDIACFKGWANLAAQGGLSNFYTSGVFTDYPPGYMYILYVAGAVKNLLGLSDSSAVFVLLLKLPAIAADILSAYLVYRMAKRRLGNGVALSLAVLIALNPAYIVNSSAWGQIDSILALLIVLSFYLFTKERPILGCLVYTAALLIKPLALLFGPVVLFLLIDEIRRRGIKGLLLSLGGIAASIAMFALLIWPFTGSQQGLWILDKYFGTASSYPYATLNSFNLMSLLGLNWVPDDTLILGIQAKVLGTVFIAAVVVCSAFLFFRSRDKNGVWLSSAFMLAGIYVLGHYMHERYIFAVLPLLILAFIHTKDKRLLWIFAGFSSTLFVNTLYVLAYTHFAANSPILLIFSGINVLLFIFLGKVCLDATREREPLPPVDDVTPVVREKIEIPESKKLNMTRRDHLLMWGVTIVYAAVALINLGSLEVPQTYWRSDYNGETVQLLFDDTYEVREVRFYGGIADGSVTLSTSTDGEFYTDVTDIEQQPVDESGNKKVLMYKWQSVDVEFSGSSVELTPRSGELWLNEIAFYDQNGEQIPVSLGAVSDVSSYANSSAAHLIDEQDRVPDVGSFMTDMYFDEIYHARTAFEHLNGLSPYENSHPPLGKIFIMVGVAVFGMNPFGWRIMGTLFGIGMVPLMYVFGKRLFKKPGYAFLGAFLFTFDFMHFAQTRIATIDSFSVFFIIAMLYFIYRFYTTTNYNTQSLKSCLAPLFLSGLMLGLGIASKWICVYAGVGVAVMLFIYIFKRYREYLYALRALPEAQGDEKTLLTGIVAGYRKKTTALFFICLLFFIVMPLAIYLASYLPYMLVVEGEAYDLSGIWGVQEFMLSYHSGLTAGHPFSSQWWQWPLIFKPIWYYKGDVPAGNVAAISSFGNPAVWWVGFAAILAVGYWAVKGRYRGDKGILLVFLGIAANFLPWIAVTRATFIYHYFATVPFMVFAIVYFFKYLEEKRPKLIKLRYAYMAAVLIFFILYYPLLSGMTVDIGYARFVKTIPGWTIFG